MSIATAVVIFVIRSMTLVMIPVVCGAPTFFRQTTIKTWLYLPLKLGSTSMCHGILVATLEISLSTKRENSREPIREIHVAHHLLRTNGRKLCYVSFLHREIKCITQKSKSSKIGIYSFHRLSLKSLTHLPSLKSLAYRPHPLYFLLSSLNYSL